MKYVQIRTVIVPLNKIISIHAEGVAIHDKPLDTFKIVLEYDADCANRITICKFQTKTKHKSLEEKELFLYNICEDITNHISYYIAGNGLIFVNNTYILDLYKFVKYKLQDCFNEFSFKEIE